MTIEPDDFAATFKALPIFYTMRSNLAMADAFLRRSIIEASNYESEDLGFFGIEPGKQQLNIHNRSVTVIVVALLYQTIENYSDLKRISPKLEYSGLEDFLSGLENKDRFVNGMRAIRNGVFHLKSLRAWRNRSVTFFAEVCDKRGGILQLMGELRSILYDFTEKVFLGELRIWPDTSYEDLDRLDEDIRGLGGSLGIRDLGTG